MPSAVDIGIGAPRYNSEAEVLTAKPWLQNVRSDDGRRWIAYDPETGQTVIAGLLGDLVLAQRAAAGASGGLAGFGLTKQGEYYDASGNLISASVFGGGLLPLPGLGALGSGKYKWLIWALVAAGVVLIVSKGSRGGLRRA
ncbi:hypothetical protein [Ferrovibrio terrae]|uniref:hypothetical protein n=1 Tax=Ferrovibrio terrae TaxID=2594003 RepID=UPI0031379501